MPHAWSVQDESGELTETEANAKYVTLTTEQTITGRKTIEAGPRLLGTGAEPASVGTTPGTEALKQVELLGGKGGVTTIATTGTGGKGSLVTLKTGAGGEATAVATSATGGAGGLLLIETGAGAKANVAGTGIPRGGQRIYDQIHQCA